MSLKNTLCLNYQKRNVFTIADMVLGKSPLAVVWIDGMNLAHRVGTSESLFRLAVTRILAAYQQPSRPNRRATCRMPFIRQICVQRVSMSAVSWMAYDEFDVWGDGSSGCVPRSETGT